MSQSPPARESLCRSICAKIMRVSVLITESCRKHIEPFALNLVFTRIVLCFRIPCCVLTFRVTSIALRHCSRREGYVCKYFLDQKYSTPIIIFETSPSASILVEQKYCYCRARPSKGVNTISRGDVSNLQSVWATNEPWATQRVLEKKKYDAKGILTLEFETLKFRLTAKL